MRADILTGRRANFVRTRATRAQPRRARVFEGVARLELEVLLLRVAWQSGEMDGIENCRS